MKWSVSNLFFRVSASRGESLFVRLAFLHKRRCANEPKDESDVSPVLCPLSIPSQRTFVTSSHQHSAVLTAREGTCENQVRWEGDTNEKVLYGSV